MNQAGRVSEQQKVLLMEREIGLQMEKLIPEMQKMAEGYNLRDERSPLRNVLNVAADPGSGVEVTKNFILYQLGRRGASRIWKHSFSGEDQSFAGKTFAVALVHVINGLREDARKVLEEMSEKSDTNQGEQELQEVHRRLMQLYLGNLARYQVFLSKKKKGNNQGRGRNQRRGRNQGGGRNVR